MCKFLRISKRLLIQCGLQYVLITPILEILGTMYKLIKTCTELFLNATMYILFKGQSHEIFYPHFLLKTFCLCGLHIKSFANFSFLRRYLIANFEISTFIPLIVPRFLSFQQYFG